MKKVTFKIRHNNLDSVFKKKKYSIYLDRGYKFEFNNLKHAKAFVVQLNDFYTDHLRMVVISADKLFSLTNTLLFQMERNEFLYFKEMQNQTQNFIMKLLHHPETENANYFKYSFFKSTYNSLNIYAEQLNNLSDRVQEYSARNEIISVSLNLKFLEKQSMEFNEDKSIEINKFHRKNFDAPNKHLKIV